MLRVTVRIHAFVGYTILGSIQASFHWGYVTFFSETSGRQCCCIALFSIEFSFLKSVSRWQMSDLDLNLYFNDRLCKHLGTSLYLSLEELPQSFLLSDMLGQVNLVRNNYEVLYSGNQDSHNYWKNFFLSDIEISQRSTLLCLAMT